MVMMVVVLPGQHERVAGRFQLDLERVSGWERAELAEQRVAHKWLVTVGHVERVQGLLVGRRGTEGQVVQKGRGSGTREGAVRTKTADGAEQGRGRRLHAVRR